MSDKIDLPRYSKGKRPHFFEDAAADHLLAMVLELSTELAVVYEKVDNLEQFLIASGQVDAEKLASFQPSDDATAKQDEWRSLFIERLYSSVRQQAAPKD